MNRNCPICLTIEPKLLFKQEFAGYDKGSLLDGYNIVSCEKCGGIYADLPLPQLYFDAYYAEMSKYEHGKISKIDQGRYEDIAKRLTPYFVIQHRAAKIADIGSSIGGLLNEFRKNGALHLVGFDPSERCVAMAEKNRICAYQKTIKELTDWKGKYDLIVMTSVLEHVMDVDGALKIIRNLMEPGARLYIEVPDITRYKDCSGAGFSLFSMEHINYWSPKSFEAMMIRNGFRIDKCEQIDRQLSETNIEPTLSIICMTTEMKRDEEAEKATVIYIEQSLRREREVHEKLEALAISREAIIVWGAGTHTLRLLATSPLAKCNIVGIVDSNPRYQGKKLHGLTIMSPNDLKSWLGMVSVLISSQISQKAIESQLLDMRWYDIIKLYPDGVMA